MRLHLGRVPLHPRRVQPQRLERHGLLRREPGRGQQPADVDQQLRRVVQGPDRRQGLFRRGLHARRQRHLPRQAPADPQRPRRGVPERVPGVQVRPDLLHRRLRRPPRMRTLLLAGRLRRRLQEGRALRLLLRQRRRDQRPDLLRRVRLPRHLGSEPIAPADEGDRPEHAEVQRLVAIIQEREAAREPLGPEWPALREVIASQLVPDRQTALDALQKPDSVSDGMPGAPRTWPRPARRRPRTPAIP
ncbi:hypothetical protein SCOCK_10293 [Actinacidiphila cocklensis]|uniref:Uncharacterized protein n=1 Tax=Actinacidiphila cocklensis TaxID=887465 RepID=A0A9W4E1E6_9ACTN|nr:hypothetical protein SCOCK_10293 [Actinacidiphila cocklensis]